MPQAWMDDPLQQSYQTQMWSWETLVCRNLGRQTFFFFWDRVSLFSPNWPWIYCVTLIGLELLLLLPQPHKSWDYRHASLCSATYTISKRWNFEALSKLCGRQ
jgi:hypothetical protein